MSGCSKRYRRLLICLNDAEFDLINSLILSHSVDSHTPSKGFIVRYALKRLSLSVGRG